MWEDEDEDFSTSTKSKLSSLFPGEDSTKADYTHKRPKKGSSSTGKSEQPAKESNVTSIYAVPPPGVDMYKYDSKTKEFPMIGTFGAAILLTAGRFSLYFYETKSKPLLNIPIYNKFPFTIQESSGNYYGSLQDDKKQRWSARFSSKEVCEKFSQYVAVATFLAGPRQEPYILDLTEGTSEGVSEGDTLGVKWTGYGVGIPPKIDTEYDSNVNDKILRVILGSGGNASKAWDKGLLGMKKGGRRIIVSTLEMASGQERGLEPPVSTKEPFVLFTIELDRIKRGVKNETPKKELQTPLPDVEDTESEKASPTVGTNEGGANKEQLLRLMEKLGQPTVGPAQTVQQNRHQGVTIEEGSGQDWNSMNNRGYNQQPYHNQGLVPPGNSYGNQMHGMYGNQMAISPLAVVSHAPQQSPYPGYPYPQSMPYQPPQVPQPIPAPAPAPTPAPSSNPPQQNILGGSQDTIQLLVDERQYKGKIDSNLNTLMAKVDQLTDRVAATYTKEIADTHASSGISAKALLQTVQRIVNDNEKLQKEHEEKTQTLDKLRKQVNELLERNQRVIDENNKYMEDRNKNFNDVSSIHKQKLDQLVDEKESLQIEMADVAAALSQANRRFTNLKKKYTTLGEELNSTREDLERERQSRDKVKLDIESAAVELNNLKQRYRDENRKMNDTLQQTTELQQTLQEARDKIDRLNAQLEDKNQLLTRERSSMETTLLTEKNNLQEQIESLKNEIRKERSESDRKVQEMEENLAEQAKQEKAQLREHVLRELERRVAAAKEAAFAEAQVQTSEDIRKALNEARHEFIAEKERAEQLILEDFKTRLTQTTKTSFEDGRRQGYKEGSSATDKALKSAALTTVRMHQTTLNSLKEKLNEEKLSSHENMLKTIKGIINDSFKYLRNQFEADKTYDGSSVLFVVKDALVSKTMGNLPQPPPGYEVAQPPPAPQIQPVVHEVDPVMVDPPQEQVEVQSSNEPVPQSEEGSEPLSVSPPQRDIDVESHNELENQLQETEPQQSEPEQHQEKPDIVPDQSQEKLEDHEQFQKPEEPINTQEYEQIQENKEVVPEKSPELEHPEQTQKLEVSEPTQEKQSEPEQYQEIEQHQEKTETVPDLSQEKLEDHEPEPTQEKQSEPEQSKEPEPVPNPEREKPESEQTQENSSNEKLQEPEQFLEKLQETEQSQKLEDSEQIQEKQSEPEQSKEPEPVPNPLDSPYTQHTHTLESQEPQEKLTSLKEIESQDLQESNTQELESLTQESNAASELPNQVETTQQVLEEPKESLTESKNVEESKDTLDVIVPNPENEPLLKSTPVEQDKDESETSQNEQNEEEKNDNGSAQTEPEPFNDNSKEDRVDPEESTLKKEDSLEKQEVLNDETNGNLEEVGDKNNETIENGEKNEPETNGQTEHKVENQDSIPKKDEEEDIINKEEVKVEDNTKDPESQILPDNQENTQNIETKEENSDNVDKQEEKESEGNGTLETKTKEEIQTTDNNNSDEKTNKDEKEDETPESKHKEETTDFQIEKKDDDSLQSAPLEEHKQENTNKDGEQDNINKDGEQNNTNKQGENNNEEKQEPKSTFFDIEDEIFGGGDPITTPIKEKPQENTVKPILLLDEEDPNDAEFYVPSKKSKKTAVKADDIFGDAGNDNDDIFNF